MAKRIVPGFKMFDAASLAATVTSSTSNVQNLDKASIFVEWTGSSPDGVLTLEARNSAEGSWYTLDFGSSIAVSGASGSHSLVLNEIPFVEIRLIYTRTSGTGSLTATIVSKAVGS